MTNECREFREWLNRLPLREISGGLKRHLEVCGECRRKCEFITPVAAALSDLPGPTRLSEEHLKRFTAAAEKEAHRKANRKTVLRMVRSLLIGLPVVGAINWLWFNLGTWVLTDLVSPEIALIYSIMFFTAVSLTGALVFGSIPLLWGYLRRYYPKEF